MRPSRALEIPRHSKIGKVLCHLHKFPITLTQGQDSGAGQEVDEDIAVDVAHPTTGRLVDRDGKVPRVRPRIGLARA